MAYRFIYYEGTKDIKLVLCAICQEVLYDDPKEAGVDAKKAADFSMAHLAMFHPEAVPPK